MGNIVCSSSKFGRNEEIEMDENDLMKTRLMISSAGWGSGSYVKWTDGSSNGGGGKLTFVKNKNEATWWSIEVIEQQIE